MMLKLSANLVAQTVAIHKSPVPISVDWQRVLEFAMFGFIQGLINYWWQHFLDRRYPAMGGGGASAASKPILPVALTVGDRGGAGQRSWRNLAMMILVDQTIGLLMMNIVLMVCTNIARERSLAGLLAVIRERVPPIIMAAWKIWPAVCFINFRYVPVRWRPVVSATVGFGWNMFLTFFMIK